MSQPALVLSPDGFQCYGAAREMWGYRGQEVIIAGPYATGKTTAWLHKVNAVACRYPGARILMVRKTYRSLIESACVTYERNVLTYPPGHPDCPVARPGGSSPSAYVYPNGSKISLGGLDRPGKLLSSEWDMICVPQAEELTLSEWEALVGRTTGRAGNVRYPQVIGDANPGPPTHWILHRTTLKLLHSRHEDNPSLFDPKTGKITPRGEQELAALDSLTGVRYLRGRLGRWVAAEGVVYEDFDRAVHQVDRFVPPESWPRIWGVDFGYTNPFVWQEWVKDPDGALYLHREIYRTNLLVEDAAREILAITAGDPDPEALICDHDAEGRATLERYLGIRATPAFKSMAPGLEAVMARLRVPPGGRPRLFVMRDALTRRDEALWNKRRPVCTTDEFEVYSWPTSRDGVAAKETPLKQDDHGMDDMRYVVAYVDEVQEGSGGVDPGDDDWRSRPQTIIGGMGNLSW